MAAKRATKKATRPRPQTRPKAAAEVKGPDPKVWGHDKDRPAADPVIEGAQLVGDKGDDGKPVKGPDPKVWGSPKSKG